MEFTAKTIAEFLNGTIIGDENTKVSDVSSIDKGKKGTLTFLANPKYAKYIYNTESSIVLVNDSLKLEGEVKATLIKVDDAYKAIVETDLEYNIDLYGNGKAGEKIVNILATL